jgi:hypothetical protein
MTRFTLELPLKAIEIASARARKRRPGGELALGWVIVGIDLLHSTPTTADKLPNLLILVVVGCSSALD